MIDRLRLAVALVVVAGGAVGVAVSPGATVAQRLLLAGIAVVVLGPTVVAAASRRFDLFSPQTIFGFAFGAMFVARPVEMLYDSNFLCCANGAEANVRPGFTTMLVAGLLGAIAFQLGYFYRRRSAGTLEPSRKIDWDSRFVFRCALGLGVLGTLLFGAFVLQGVHAHGLSSFLGRGTNQSALYAGSTAYLYDGMFLLSPATLLFVGSVAFGRENRRRAAALAVLFGGLMVASALPSGNRTALLVLLGALFVFYFLRRHRRPTLIASLVVLLVCFFAVSILRDSRYATVRQEGGVGQVAEYAFEHPAQELGRLISGGDVSMAPALALETEIVPSHMGYRYGGATLGDIVTRPIPHVLWKGKPLEPEAALTSRVWPTEFKSGLVHPVYSVMGTFYLDFGLWGVFAGMLLVGLVYRFVDARLLRTRDEGLIVILAAVVPFLVIGLRDSVPDAAFHIFFAVLPLVVAVELARRRDATRRMRWTVPKGVRFWLVAAGVVLVVAFAGVEATKSSTSTAPLEQGAIQPAMLVGTANPHGPAALPAVVATVKAAQHGDPIPSPLVPSLFGLAAFGAPPGCYGANGSGVTRAAMCYASGPKAVPRSTPTPGRKTLVVFGDSHAEMWISPLLAMAGHDNWDVVPMWKGECTPSILFTNDNSQGTLAECRTWYQWALRTIARLHPNTVFISFLGNYSGTTATSTENGIASLLSTEKKVAKHVVLMLDDPYLASLPPVEGCLHEPHATLRTCTGAWSESPSSQALRAIARAHHAGFIDPLGWFCYQGRCPLVIGHTIAYADYGLVSQTYATALSPPFRAAFRAALHGG